MGWDVHEDDGLAHYARACTDVTFRFPFGEQELMGIAARGNFDLTAHTEGSGKSEQLFSFFFSFAFSDALFCFCLVAVRSFLRRSLAPHTVAAVVVP